MLISEWSCEDVRQWLIAEGFGEYAETFCDVHGVDGDVLLTLNEKDLRNPPLQIKKLSDIKKLGKCLTKIQQKSLIEQNAYKNSHTTNGATTSNGKIRRQKATKKQYTKIDYHSEIDSDNISYDSDDTGHFQYFVDMDGTERYGTAINKKDKFLPQYDKLLVSFLYAVIASWVSAFTMVLVHERVPDKEKYPPLPDIFLDNVPFMPHAFKLAEICGLLLASLFLGILVFHKHRIIVLRRFFSITSTVFLLRSCTMFVTSLSVPGKHLNCQAMYNSQWQRVTRATQIVMGFGMTLNGVNSCGDYMFSGHTAYLTIFNHLITEYFPQKLYYVHTFAWVLHLFGLFFVLAAHEHYSIDVLIAFYITSRIFLYYHMLANTRSFWHSKRIRIWFPLLSYFECDVPGKVPNEFSWPISTSNLRSFIDRLSPKLKTKMK